MFRIADIVDEAKKIIGICDEVKLFRWCADVTTLIANKADLEGWKGSLDICTTGCACETGGHCGGGCCGLKCVTLPREVQTVLTVNINGHPALGFGQLFEHHLNGPGNCGKSCEYSWYDQGAHWPIYRDLIIPAKLVAYLQTAEDNTAELIVYGYDTNGVKLRRKENGTWLDGYRVPTIFGLAIPDVGAPLIARITGVFKALTVGSVRLSTIDDSGLTGVLLAVYENDETLPQYRRIKINQACKWVRVAYMKTNPSFSSLNDHIPLQSRLGFLLGMQARKNYSDLQLADAHAFEADAARLEVEAQMKLEAPLYFPIQILDRAAALHEKSDYGIV